MNKWVLMQNKDGYIDFDKEVMSCGDEGDTTLDVQLTFSLEDRSAYMTVAWHNDDGKTQDMHDSRVIQWDAAIRMIENDVELPEELK